MASYPVKGNPERPYGCHVEHRARNVTGKPAKRVGSGKVRSVPRAN